MPKLFVVMPFGTRKINDNKEIDFDNVYNNLILDFYIDKNTNE